MTVTDYPDWDTHQANATAIANTGVPLLSAAASLFKMTSPVSVPAGATQAIAGGPFTLNQIGYEVQVQAQDVAGAAFPFGTLIFTWSDSVSGNTVWVDKFAIAAGSAVMNPYAGVGPTKGDTLAVTFTNYDSVNAMSVQASMVQNSRVYVRDDMRQVLMKPVPNQILGNYSQAAGFLLQTQPTVTPGTPAFRLMAFYAGRVTISAVSVVAYTIQINAFNGEISASGGNEVFAAAITAAGGGQIQLDTSLPRCQCQLEISNNGGSAEPISASVVISEQQA